MENNIITDQTLIPFGKYKDKKKMIDVPAFYLLYTYEKGYIPSWCPQVKKYILDNWQALLKEAGRLK